MKQLLDKTEITRNPKYQFSSTYSLKKVLTNGE